MKGVTLSFKNGDIAIADLPTPNVGTRSVLVANHHSLISNGTEGYIVRMSSKGPIGKALDRPDLAKQVIQRALTDGFWNTTKVVRNLISARCRWVIPAQVKSLQRVPRPTRSPLVTGWRALA